jgi:NADH-quinone oxidoreductase subunit H
MREAAQVVSYEVPLGMCVVVPCMICGTLNLVTIGNMQAGLFTNWLAFNDPATFIVACVYFTCATASVNRAPFDLAEAESELVAGFHTEYSGLRWSFFFMAEYGSMFLVSGLAAILFFGGWHGPIPIFGMLGWTQSDGILHHIANLGGCLNFLLKGTIGVTVMMWVRWTLPRLRIDQVMTTCLKYCVPIAAFGFLGALVWQVQEWPTLSDLPVVGITRSDARESWVIEADREPRTAAAAPSPSDASAEKHAGVDPADGESLAMQEGAR